MGETISNAPEEYVIRSPEHVEIKRLVGLAEPGIKSSHRAEAIARGLGFNTNAALAAALSGGQGIRVVADDKPFGAFLAERGYDTGRFRVSLLLDAVRIAIGANPIVRPEVRTTERRDFSRARLRPCIKCFDSFFSMGAGNMLCTACHADNGRVPGCEHAPNILGQALSRLLHEGTMPTLDRLRARPGWSDILDGEELKEMIERTLETREDVRAGRLDRLPEQQQRLMQFIGKARYLSQFSF
jgi:hypothetical protein